MGESTPRRRINKTTMATLNRVYRETRFPSDEMIKEVSKHTRLPPRRVTAWFQEQRRSDMQRKHGVRDEDRTRPVDQPKRRWY